MNQIIECILKNRQYKEGFLTDIECYSHGMLRNADVICSKLHSIKESNKRIVLVVDFDMDGLMCGVASFAGLAELGFNVSLFIPDPKEGYGFTKATVKRLVSQYPDVEVVMTGDVGITCYEGVDYLKSLGIEVLLTDHHMQDKEINADVIVNPNALGETYEHPSICGAYVIYQVLQEYANTYCDKFMQEQIMRLRVFAGIGTISDMMPVLYENRKLIRDAIDICKLIYLDGNDFVVNSIPGCDIYRRAFYGLYTTLSAFAAAGKLQNADSIDEQFFGYYLAPTFNSVKRMDGNMSDAFGVFFDSEPLTKVNNLIAMNDKRKDLEQQYLKELQTIPQPYAPYVYLSSAPSGITGLLAQKMMKQSGCPSCVVSFDNNRYHGSGRSPEWYPLFDRTHDHFHVAGHNAAFGVGFTDERELKAFVEYVKKDSEDVKKTVEFVEEKPDCVISSDGTGDVLIDLWLFAKYLIDIKSYKPFGKGFEKPELLLKFRADEGEWHTMGGAKQHLKVKLMYGFEVLLWNQANKRLEYIDNITKTPTNRYVYVLGDIQESEFGGVKTFNFVGTIVDVDEGDAND